MGALLSCSVPWPASESFAQSGDLTGAKPEDGEDTVAPLVQPPAGVAKVPVFQARIQTPRPADHLIGSCWPRTAAMSM